ncbi:MAG: hypothetical protein H6550_13080 [Chitinophagales bacterium]|nr:hypothetical protein [Chitinophagales bacterium]
MKLYRITILATLFFIAATAAFAQKVIYSQYDKFDFRSGEFSVVGKVGSKLYVYRGSSEGYYLDAYDSDMQRVATVVLDFIPRRAFGTKFVTYPGKIIVLYQETESGKVIQHAALLDGTGRLQKPPMVIDEVKASFLGGRSGLYNYAISQDKQHIVVYGAGTKGSELNTKVIWLDAELNKQSESLADFKGDNTLEFGSGIVDDQGRFFLSAYTPYGSRSYADRIWLLSLTTGSRQYVATEVPMGELFASGTYMELSNDNDKIYVGGFFSDRKNGNFEGIIYTYYDIAEQVFKEFRTIKFTDKLRNAASDRNKKRAFNDFQVRELIVRNDGGFVMITEEFYVSTRNSYNQGFGYYSWYYPSMSASVREYNYGDILAISCSGDGTPEWVEFVRKQQYSQEDGGLFSSYALLNTGGALGFLFNDFNMNHSRIQLATLDASGRLSMDMLAGAGRDAPDWLPKSGKQVSAKEFVVPCLKRNQICFAKVVF